MSTPYLLLMSSEGMRREILGFIGAFFVAQVRLRLLGSACVWKKIMIYLGSLEKLDVVCKEIGNYILSDYLSHCHSGFRTVSKSEI